ncbi:aspartate carbamoyltransferase [Candidatus Woesearchaeota archaeon]|nr:aspartate carbamoyltransferase [Candidatus Woesearchaeota archaeon]
MGFKNRDIISIRDFSKAELLHVLDVAADIERNGTGSFSQLLKGKILASLFFEPSTRTRLSFEASMHRLGGSVIGFSEPETTSIVKGETAHDTIRIVDGYCDIMVMRHPESGSATKAAEAAKNPVINAGDGANEHPTQTFVDLYTIRKTKGSLERLSIGFLGDLKYGRTVHSLSHALSHFSPDLYFISPESLALPDRLIRELESSRIKIVEEENLSRVSRQLDILYVTRIQKERFLDEGEYAKVKGFYKLDKEFLKSAKPDLKILHPLPRVDEINPRLDSEKQSIYFEQAHNGIPVRMALLGLVLGCFE